MDRPTADMIRETIDTFWRQCSENKRKPTVERLLCDFGCDKETLLDWAGQPADGGMIADALRGISAVLAEGYLKEKDMIQPESLLDELRSKTNRTAGRPFVIDDI